MAKKNFKEKDNLVTCPECNFKFALTESLRCPRCNTFPFSTGCDGNCRKCAANCK